MAPASGLKQAEFAIVPVEVLKVWIKFGSSLRYSHFCKGYKGIRHKNDLQTKREHSHNNLGKKAIHYLHFEQLRPGTKNLLGGRSNQSYLASLLTS